MINRNWLHLLSPKVFLVCAILFFLHQTIDASGKQITIDIGVDHNPPLSYVGQNGSVSGFFPELIKYIAAKEGWNIRLIPVDWTEGLLKLDQNKIDLLVDIAYSSERAKRYHFLKEPVLSNWAVIYADPGKKISSFPDLEGKRIAVMRNSIHTNDKDGGIIALLSKFSINATFLEVNNYNEVFRLISTGKADAGVVNRIFGTRYKSQYGLRNTGLYFNPVMVHFAFSKNSELASRIERNFNRQLRHLKTIPNSFFYQLIQKHFFTLESPAPLVENRYLAYGLGGTILLGLFLFLIVLFLKYRVHLQTRKLKQQNLQLKENIENLNVIKNELQRSRDQLSLALEACNAGLWDFNPQTNDIYLSDTWFTMLGYAPDELPRNRQTWVTLLHPDDRNFALAKIQFFLDHYSSENLSHYENEFRLKTKTGDWKWIRSMAKAFQFDSDGSHIRIIGTHININENKKTLLALQHSESLHEKAQKLAHIGHWRRDLSTNESIWSDEVYRIFEIDKTTAHISYDHFINLIHPDDQPRLESLLKKAIEEHSDYEIAYRLMFDDGRVKFLQEQCSIEYNDDDKPVRFVGTTQDITLLKKAEQDKVDAQKQLRQVHKIQAIGTLAGGIAHDFNNILTPIIGYTQIAIEESPKNSDFVDILEAILKSSLRAKSLIQQILTFSREEEQELQPLKIQPVIKETLKLLRSTLPASIDIKENIQEEIDLINGDPTQLHQIIMNLCTNAYHAMKKEGGTLSILLSRETVSDPKLHQLTKLLPGVYLKLSVIDTGVGITPDIIEKIFDPYFTTKDGSDGTGLGLSVVHGIIESLKGEVTVQSTPGKGSIFNVWFPVIFSAVAEEEIFDDEYTGGCEHILLIDDEVDLLSMLKKMLFNLGYKITAFNDSQEALESFKQESEKYNLVITDLTMPKMNGLELSKEIKSIRNDIKIGLCTGYSYDLEENDKQAAGIDFLLMKPVIRSDLSKAIRNALDSRISL